MRYTTGLVILIAASMACSRTNDRVASVTPTAPTSVAASADATIAYVGGVSGPMDVLFPGRDQSFQFRIELEVKYARDLGRPPQASFVDPEGEVVWMQEYIRYRVNGCDHATAIARVLAQIDGGPAGGICAAPPDGVVNFPPRNDIFDARRALEAKYQQMGRAATQTAVDAEGSAIWITEYLRYRTNGCGHAEAQEKVFSQIDGGPVPPLCTTACSYSLSPDYLRSDFRSSTQSFQVRPVSATSQQCTWTAASTVPWLTFAATQSPNSGFVSDFAYSIAQNHGGSRTGYIDFTWQGGSARYRVDQDAIPFAANFTLVDPFRSSATTTECWIRSASTPCNFTANANLPGGGAYTYNWSATYLYDTTKTFVQNNNSNVFSFSEACGLAGSSADGTVTDLNVTLTITDSLGNTMTLRSGEGNQPALRIRLFTC